MGGWNIEGEGGMERERVRGSGWNRERGCNRGRWWNREGGGGIKREWLE